MYLDVKTCGLSTPDAIAAALERGATHLGFVFFPRSPRHLSLEAMARLRPLVAGRALLTVVAVDPSDDFLDEMMRLVAPDLLQLHGLETPARVAEIKARTGIPVMKAVSVGSREDLAAVASYRGVADRILLDAKKPKDAELPGGNGVSFDWTILSDLDPGLGYMLSGGLDAGNVGEALRRLRPAGIDVSSGIESRPGQKDVRLIHRFFDAVAAADRADA